MLIGMRHAMTLCCIFDIHKSACGEEFPIVYAIIICMACQRYVEACPGDDMNRATQKNDTKKRINLKNRPENRNRRVRHTIYLWIKRPDIK